MSQGLVTLNGYKWGTAPSLFHSCQIHGEVNILKVSIEMPALWIDLVDKSISLAGPSQCKSRLQGRQNLKPGGRESSQRRVGLTSQSSRREKKESMNEILSSFYSRLN